jgi:hypothetical protein
MKKQLMRLAVHLKSIIDAAPSIAQRGVQKCLIMALSMSNIYIYQIADPIIHVHACFAILPVLLNNCKKFRSKLMSCLQARRQSTARNRYFFIKSAILHD